MIPVMQKIPYGDRADCMRACVASLFELSIEDVPNFMERGSEGYYKELNEWSSKYSMIAVDIKFLEEEEYYLNLFTDTYMITVGYSPRQKKANLLDKEKIKHGVIYKNNKLAHDPHPDQGGIAGEPLQYTIFLPKDSPKFFRSLKEIK